MEERQTHYETDTHFLSLSPPPPPVCDQSPWKRLRLRRGKQGAGFAASGCGGMTMGQTRQLQRQRNFRSKK